MPLFLCFPLALGSPLSLAVRDFFSSLKISFSSAIFCLSSFLVWAEFVLLIHFNKNFINSHRPNILAEWLKHLGARVSLPLLPLPFIPFMGSFRVVSSQIFL